ncbi:MAG: isochorismatase family protein [Myxococcota bacterium]
MTRSALVLLDYQDNLVDMVRTDPPARVRLAASAIANIASALELPSFASVIPFGVDSPVLLQGVGETLPDLKVVGRNTIEPFAHPESAAAIEALGRPHLVMAGVFTEIIVLHAARAALSLGYGVTVLADGCGGFGAKSEDVAFHELRAAGARVTSIATWSSSQMSAWDAPEAERIGQATASLLAP